MVAILEFAAGYTIDEVIRAALAKINGYSLTVKRSRASSMAASPDSRSFNDYDTETARDLFRMNNGTLLESNRWVFLAIIRRTTGHGNKPVTESASFTNFPLAVGIDAVATHDFQRYPKEYINVAPEQMIDLFPQYYINVLATRLAKEMCIPLRGDINMRRIMESAYNKDLASARIADNRLAARMGYFYYE